MNRTTIRLHTTALALLILCSTAGCGRLPGGQPSKSHQPAAQGQVKVRWVAARGDLDLEGEVENGTGRELDNLFVEVTMTGVDPSVTRTTSAPVAHSTPAVEYRTQSGRFVGQAPQGLSRSIPAGERGGFLLQSVVRSQIQRVEVYRVPPGTGGEAREVLAVYPGSEVR